MLDLRLTSRKPPPHQPVRCEQIDALTAVIALDGELTPGRLDRLRRSLTRSLQTGAAFVVVDLPDSAPADGLDQILADAAGPLARRDGGLAVVGSRAQVTCGEVGVFSTRAEALAGVRGRLTPRRSIHAAPRRPTPRRPGI